MSISHSGFDAQFIINAKKSVFAHSWFIRMLWLVHMPPPCWECFMLLELILASAVSSKWYKFDGHMKALRIKLAHTINVGLKSIKANFIVGGARKQTILFSSGIFYPLPPPYPYPHQKNVSKNICGFDIFQCNGQNINLRTCTIKEERILLPWTFCS